ncbi:acyl-homoserine-lactone synthase [Pandoraea commovens]|uniref:Acyl-homoserine-lactone synthase n=1 Tax=Pandoraea commovens TaxID=2508289 RepID=A0ABY5QD01_9BURK|nr:acyl-homoserine-lactone synthase [Pandoraea commovens]UVA78198.1 acyl-homoserine-lactone synthase [Pandoraea commovens]
MRVDVITGAQMMPAMRAELARFRHRVFVERLGWRVPDQRAADAASRGEEADEYDHEETVYVTLRGPGEEIVGCARLLPATRRFLLKDHFQYLVDDLPAALSLGVPASIKRGANGVTCGSDGGSEHFSPDDTACASVWELSRFALSLPVAQSHSAIQGARELLRAAMFAALALGAKRLVGVTYVSLARLFVRLGVPTHRLGKCHRIDGRWVAAYRIDVDPIALTALGLTCAATPAADMTLPPGMPEMSGMPVSTPASIPDPRQRHMTSRMAL